MQRLLLIIGVIGCYVGQFYLLAALLCLYTLYRYTGFEVVIAAALLDAYYGAFTGFPVLTIGAFVGWSVALVLRERLMLYTHEYETLS